jgi:hypothetical protein
MVSVRDGKTISDYSFQCSLPPKLFRLAKSLPKVISISLSFSHVMNPFEKVKTNQNGLSSGFTNVLTINNGDVKPLHPRRVKSKKYERFVQETSADSTLA